MDAFTRAIQLKKDFVEAYHNRGQMHYLRGDYDLAINDYPKVLRINSEWINARTHRALAFGKTGNAGLMYRDLKTACRMAGGLYFFKGKWCLVSGVGMESKCHDKKYAMERTCAEAENLNLE